MSVYESILTGLTEALEDSKSERKTLKRNIEVIGDHYTVKLDNEKVKVETQIRPGDGMGFNSKICGYTETMKLVNVQCDKNLIGTIQEVTITDAKSFSLDGIIE